ncbi:MAG: hypothetical protein QF805_25295, partial [Pirellulaceae bacterium]|nr:hypothetical protein [Pirellulaceae bacterium]
NSCPQSFGGAFGVVVVFGSTRDTRQLRRKGATVRRGELRHFAERLLRTGWSLPGRLATTEPRSAALDTETPDPVALKD